MGTRSARKAGPDVVAGIGAARHGAWGRMPHARTLCPVPPAERNRHGVHLRLRRELLTSLAAIPRMTSAASERTGPLHARAAGILRSPGLGRCDVMYPMCSLGKLRLDAGS